MVNKKVPEWLNSSLWSAPQPSLSPQTSQNPGAAIVEAPAVVARPESASTSKTSTAPVKEEDSDPLGGSHGNDGGVSYNDDENGSFSAHSTASSAGVVAAWPPPLPAVEDVSRHAQLLQEVFLSPSAHPSLTHLQ